MLTSLEIKAVAAAATASALLLTGAFAAATIYRVHRHADHEAREPVPSELVTSKGRRLFFRSCAHCHGQDADGGEDAPSLCASCRSAAPT